MTSPMPLPAAFIEALIGASEDVGADLLCITGTPTDIDLAATFICPDQHTIAFMTIAFEASPATMIRAHVASALNQILGELEA